MTTTEFEILHSLRVKGLAKAEVLSALSGVPVDEVEAACAPLIEAGLVVARGSGAMGGFMLTPAGKEEATQRLAQDESTTAAKDALARFDEAFLPLNTEFKKICHSWQMKADGQPNSHNDAGYDAGVVKDLGEFHQRFLPALAALGAELDRFDRYSPRLSSALERIEGGDSASFARPMYDSYHDIWMELHNDVVLSLGRQRGAADEQAH